MSAEYVFKYIIIGDSGVGKSSLMTRFVEGSFATNLTHTVGVEFGTRSTELGSNRVKLQIWDTAGQERFRSVTRSYYRGAAGAILVFDVTRRNTFLHLTQWLTDARNLTNPHTVIMIVGNKVDLAEQREVSFEEASQFAQENNLIYTETSAKTGANVEDAFLSSAKRIFDHIQNGVIDMTTIDSGVTFPVTSLVKEHPVDKAQEPCAC